MFFKSNPFDFSKYLINDKGFVVKSEYPKGKTLVKKGIEISVFETIDINGYNKVEIVCGGIEVASMKFIPKSKTMVDIMLNQIYVDFYGI